MRSAYMIGACVVAFTWTNPALVAADGETLSGHDRGALVAVLDEATNGYDSNKGAGSLKT